MASTDVSGRFFLNRASVTLEMLKFEHTLFALPFAFIGMTLAARSLGQVMPTVWQVVWVSLAMVGARSFSMALNRLIDREIDARNPRTMDRALPRGLLSKAFVEVCITGSAALALFAAWMLEPLALYAAPVLMALFVFYSYTKRFTWLCHLVLGLCLGLAPVGAWIGLTNGVSLGIITLGIAVALWTTGFDIIYACQDIEVDRKEGLFSIPARFGVEPALRLTRGLHVSAVGFLLLTGVLFNLGIIYYLGVGSVAVLLFYENCLVKPDNLARLNAAFFTMNGVISVVIFGFTLVDLLLMPEGLNLL
jgi:4-hydroxybenzoate polyprenyltransferase